MGRSTLNRWFSNHGFPDKQKKRMLEPYMPYLRQRWDTGISNKMQLYREIVSQGFTGSHALVYIYFTELEAGLEPRQQSAAQPQRVKRYTAYEATRLFTHQKEELTQHDKKCLEHLFSSLKEAELCYALVQRFIALFKRKDQEVNETIQAFSRWLGDAKTSGIAELARLAKGFSNDKAAIEAALTLPWSNGQTEGKITKLKYLKRQMYGRAANFDLLRRRVLLA